MSRANSGCGPATASSSVLRRVLRPATALVAAMLCSGGLGADVAGAAEAATVEAHELVVTIDPEQRTIRGEDRMRVRGDGPVKVHLSKGFRLTSAKLPGGIPTAFECSDADSHPVAVPVWTITRGPGSPGASTVVVTWDGPLEPSPPPPTLASHEWITVATISDTGILLRPSVKWHPKSPYPAAYDLSVALPAGWAAVADGRRGKPSAGLTGVWKSRGATSGVSLAAGRWSATTRRAGATEVAVWMPAADEQRAAALAARAAERLLHYEAICGPWPFERLDIYPAETGCDPERSYEDSVVTAAIAVPTAPQNAGSARDGAEAPESQAAELRRLDAALIRGWWGDSVRDPERWAPALVEYVTGPMSAGRGVPEGAAARRDAADPAPREGRSGWEQRAFLFHTVRREIGDDAFWAVLRAVTAEHAGREATWKDWQAAFERRARRNLATHFEQALRRTGAPLVELHEAKTTADTAGFRVTGVLRQNLAPGEASWQLTVPVVVEHADGAETTLVSLGGDSAAFSLAVPAMPIRVEIDPEYDVFRRAPPPRQAGRVLLGDPKTPVSPVRAFHVIEALTAPDLDGRLAGSPGEARARQIIASELRLCGIEPQETAFTFTVKHLDITAVTLRITPAGGGDPVEIAGAMPLAASPAASDLALAGIADENDADVRDCAMLVDLGAAGGASDAAAASRFLRQAASIASARGAKALIVRLPDPAPDETPSRLADLCAFPETLAPAAPDESATQRLVRAGRIAARLSATAADGDLAVPAIVVPHSFVADRTRPASLNCAVSAEEIRSANLTARIRTKARSPRGTIVLAAHTDSLGPGFPGADAGASGVAAVLEAVQVLSTQPELLDRDVVVAFFGAEEWGGRGARAFARSLPERHGILAAIVAGPVGGRAAPAMTLTGPAEYQRAARTLAAALEQSEFTVARERIESAPSDAPAAAAVALTGRGFPVLVIASGAPGTTGTAADTASATDAVKVSRAGRALALAATAVTRGE